MKQGVLIHSVETCSHDLCHNPGCPDPVLKKGKKCARCKTVRYCSTECQTADWKDHKSICIDVDKVNLFEKKIFERLSCPLSKVYPCHFHAGTRLSKSQRETLERFGRLVSLDSKSDYMLSCACNKLVSTLTPGQQIQLVFVKQHDFLVIFAKCNKDTRCEPYSIDHPLFVWYRVSNLSEELSIVLPFPQTQRAFFSEDNLEVEFVKFKENLIKKIPRGFQLCIVAIKKDDNGCSCKFEHVMFSAVIFNEADSVFGLPFPCEKRWYLMKGDKKAMLEFMREPFPGR